MFFLEVKGNTGPEGGRRGPRAPASPRSRRISLTTERRVDLPEGNDPYPTRAGLVADRLWSDHASEAARGCIVAPGWDPCQRGASPGSLLPAVNQIEARSVYAFDAGDGVLNRLTTDLSPTYP